ncbi:MAG: tetratricopeptide repeat protein, partial [Treponema sp.]|nr:tetratricopeptide repeat protein [Treponema sp.]
TGRILETQPDTLHRELRYRNHYNTGMVLFSKGDFAGAADSFRQALRVNSGRLEAMRNLELSLMSIEREGASGIGGGGEDDGTGTGTEAMALVFQHIRQREVDQWRNREWPEDEYVPGGDDR